MAWTVGGSNFSGSEKFSLHRTCPQMSPETHATSSTSDNGAHCMALKTHLHLAIGLRMSRNVDCVWNVMVQAQKPVFIFRRNGPVLLNKPGRQFSRLLAAEVCASAVIMLDTPCSEVAWRVLATHSMRQFPLHFPSRASPSAIQFQLESTSIPPVCQPWHGMGDLYLYEELILSLQDALMLSIRTEHPSDHFKICCVLPITECIQEGVNLSLRCEGTAALKLCGLLDIKRVHTRHWHATSKLCTLPAAVK